MSEVGRIAEQTSAAITATVEQVEAGAQIAIDAANARAANAEAASAAIADAAISRAVQQQIDDLKEEIDECRDQSETQQAQIAEICLEMKEIREQLAKATTVQIVETTTNNPPEITQSIPLQSATTTTTIVNPASADGPRDANEVREEPSPRRRLI